MYLRAKHIIQLNINICIKLNYRLIEHVLYNLTTVVENIYVYVLLENVTKKVGLIK